MDKDALLAFLHERVLNVRPPIAKAIYAGLITRVERDQFATGTITVPVCETGR